MVNTERLVKRLKLSRDRLRLTLKHSSSIRSNRSKKIKRRKSRRSNNNKNQLPQNMQASKMRRISRRSQQHRNRSVRLSTSNKLSLSTSNLRRQGTKRQEFLRAERRSRHTKLLLRILQVKSIRLNHKSTIWRANLTVKRKRESWEWTRNCTTWRMEMVLRRSSMKRNLSCLERWNNKKRSTVTTLTSSRAKRVKLTTCRQTLTWANRCLLATLRPGMLKNLIFQAMLLKMRIMLQTFKVTWHLNKWRTI